VATLPGEITCDEIAMPERDRHSKAKIRALDALRGYFTRQRRRIYLAPELPVYYLPPCRSAASRAMELGDRCQPPVLLVPHVRGLPRRSRRDG